MPDYQKMYLKLFDAQTEAMAAMSTIMESLMEAHQEAEQIYIDSDDSSTEIPAADADKL